MTPPPQATIQRGPARAGQSPTLLGDINNDGIVDIRDYGIWRQQFGATDCGNPADLARTLPFGLVSALGGVLTRLLSESSSHGWTT